MNHQNKLIILGYVCIVTFVKLRTLAPSILSENNQMIDKQTLLKIKNEKNEKMFCNILFLTFLSLPPFFSLHSSGIILSFCHGTEPSGETKYFASSSRINNACESSSSLSLSSSLLPSTCSGTYLL